MAFNHARWKASAVATDAQLREDTERLITAGNNR
jgi:hypothetical protein